MLSHGWPLNADAWEAAALFLAEHGHRAIAHDRRGHGRSSQTWNGNEMDTYADDLACLIETLDLRDLTLVGPSTGGGEVVRYVGRHGTDRVAKVGPGLRRPAADAAAPTTTPTGVPIEVFDAIRAGEAADRSQLYRDLADGPFFGHNRRARRRPGHPRRVLAPGHACGHRAAYECIAAFSATDFRPDLAARRPHPGHPRRRRPDRAVRGRRQALRRAGHRRRAQGLRGRAARHHRHPPATGSPPTCSRSSTADHAHATPATTRRRNHHDRTLDTRHGRPRPRTLGDPAQLGALGRPTTRRKGFDGPRPRPTPASRSRSRPCAPTPTSSPSSPSPRPSTTSTRSSRRSRSPPIIMGHSFGGALHPAPARPRPRRRRRRRSTPPRPRASGSSRSPRSSRRSRR